LIKKSKVRRTLKYELQVFPDLKVLLICHERQWDPLFIVHDNILRLGYLEIFHSYIVCKLEGK